MPEIRCPRCHTALREEDSCVFSGEAWLHDTLTIRLDCWACTWWAEWQASDSRMFGTKEIEAEAHSTS